MALDCPAWVADYIGIPFVCHGRSHDGADCWGLIALVLKERFSIIVPDYQYRSIQTLEDVPSVEQNFYDAKAESRWSVVTRGQEQEGDVVLLLVGGHLRHCGLVVAPGTMLHTLEATGSCIDGYTGPRHRNAVEGIYRHGVGV